MSPFPTDEETGAISHLLRLLGQRSGDARDSIYFGHMLVFLRSQRAAGHAAAIKALREPSERMVKAVAGAFAKQFHKHALGTARWEKWRPEALFACHAAADQLEREAQSKPASTGEGG